MSDYVSQYAEALDVLVAAIVAKREQIAAIPLAADPYEIDVTRLVPEAELVGLLRKTRTVLEMHLIEYLDHVAWGGGPQALEAHGAKDIILNADAHGFDDSRISGLSLEKGVVWLADLVWIIVADQDDYRRCEQLGGKPADDAHSLAMMRAATPHLMVRRMYEQLLPLK